MTASEFSWSCGPLAALLLLLAAIGAVVVVTILYRREAARRRSPRLLLGLLLLLRVLAIVVTAGMVLGPVTVPIERHTTLPPLVILRDVSQSMGHVDRYTDVAPSEAATGVARELVGDDKLPPLSRLDLLARLLQADQQRLLRQWMELGRLRLIDFDTSAREVSLPSPSSNDVAWPAAPAEGRGTDLAQAIRTALAGEKPAAILLLTDGQHTSPNAPTAAAVEAREQSVPLLIVGVGDPARPKNVAVTAVHTRPRVWKEEPLEIEAWLTSQQVGPGPATVTLFEPERRAVATQTVALPSLGGSSRVVFRHAVSKPGPIQFIVRVTPMADEANVEDNVEDNERATLPVEVLDRERLRVLVIGGAPTWDFQLLQRQLSRDSTLETSFWLQTSDGGRPAGGTRRLETLPTTVEDLAWYDVLLLVDPDPEQATPDWYDAVKRFSVEQGGGLLYLAGPRFAVRWIASDTTLPIREMLPVTWPDAESIATRELLDAQTRGWPLRFAPTAWEHPLLRQGDEEKTDASRSERNALVFWSLPIDTVRPTAQVLLEHGDPATRVASGQRPLLVVDRFGAARVAYLGSQGTWRWRLPGEGVGWGEQFWSRMVRYLAEGRTWEGQRRGWLQTDRDHYEIGDRIIVSAQINNLSGLSGSEHETGAVLVAGQEQPLRFVPVAEQPGRFEAVWTARRVGAHQFRWQPQGSVDTESLPPLETTVAVDWPRIETESTWLDRDRLRELARQSDGQYRDWWQIDELTPYIPDRREVVEWRRRPIPLWDRGEVLLLLVLIVGLEWGLRRRYKWQ